MTSTGNDRALNIGLLLGQALKPCLKIDRFYQQTYFPILLWFDPPSKIFTKKQWSFDWTWKDCLVTSKGPGRYPSCQQLVKTFYPHCRRKKNDYINKFSTFVQNHELLPLLFPRHLLIDDLWKLNYSVELYLWFHEQITDNSTIVLINTNATGSITLQTCKS